MTDQLRLGLIAAALMLLAVPVAARTPEAEPPMRDTPSFNYQLHCSGCHKANGSGQGVFVPNFRGEVGQFLHTPEGRSFLVRVPGVAQSLLNDRQTADVLNWLVRSFDPENVPKNFRPYTAEEVKALRRQPISDTARTRALILNKPIAGTNASRK